ncbi:MAG: hypothetical protein Q7L19_06985 [Pseudohongiella sp.]|nr:hypothetical protein [Pseudohongiella sp.]
MSYLRYSLLSIASAFSAISINAFATDPITLPEPTGPFAVGRTLHYIDTDQDEPWTEVADDKRELPLLIWYPTDIKSGSSPDYLPYGKEANSERFNAVREWSSKLTTHSLQDVPIASTPKAFPIIVFSPGTGTGPWGYHMILEDLASHGFIAVGIDHPYQGSGQILRNGTFIQPAPGVTFDPKSEEGSEEYAIELQDWYMGLSDTRTDDIRSAVKALRDLNVEADGLFHDRLDLDRIGTLGHSMGGIAAAHALTDVDGIQSGVNIDGHFDNLTFDPARTPAKPFMAIKAEGPIPSDELLHNEGFTRERYVSAWRTIYNQQAATYRQIEQGAYRIVIDGAHHSSVHDNFLIRSQDTTYEGGNPIDIVKAARTYLLAFFQKTLLGTRNTALDIMPEELYSFTSVEQFRRSSQ